MVATYSYAYCTTAQVFTLLSQDGVRNFLDDDRVGEADSTYVTDCLEMATSEINLYLTPRYSRELLQLSPWVKWCAATLAALFMTRRKGLSAPGGLVERYTQLIDILKQIQQGILPVPDGIPERNDSAPAMSNVTIDARYQTAKARVERTISTGSQPKNGIVQNPDVNDRSSPQWW